MLKTLLYLSPQFPRNYIRFIAELHRLGVQVLGVSPDPYEALPPELQASLTDHVRVASLEDYAEVLEAGRRLKHKHGQIDRIESHCEHWLGLEASLRDDLDVWGLDRRQTAFLRRKSSMKELFGRAGVAVAKGRTTSGSAEALAFAAEVGYPLVAKPDVGVGAAATFRIETPGNLEAIFSRPTAIATFLEEFVPGTICTYDGLTDNAGGIVYCNSLTYSQGVMDVVNLDQHVYYYTARAIPADLENAGRNVVAACGLREKFFHFEFFRTQDGRLLGLELNLRPPGGLTTDMWNFADDIDLYRGWARVVTGLSLDQSWNRKYHVIYISRKDHLPYAHAHEQVLARYSALLCHWERMPALFARAMGNTGYILRSPSLEELLEAAAYVQEAPAKAIVAAK